MRRQGARNSGIRLRPTSAAEGGCAPRLPLIQCKGHRWRGFHYLIKPEPGLIWAKLAVHNLFINTRLWLGFYTLGLRPSAESLSLPSHHAKTARVGDPGLGDIG